MALGDLNGDGRLDLVTGGSVYLNNGNGTFYQGPSSVPDGPGILLADFNRDGHLDIVATQWDRTLRLALGNGDGSFGAQSYVFGGYELFGLASGDFDGDGWLDLAVADSRILVLRNDRTWQRYQFSYTRGRLADSAVDAESSGICAVRGFRERSADGMHLRSRHRNWKSRCPRARCSIQSSTARYRD